jgi:mRNA deadenylase 3'-5' endonuclease subunit Ccr4
MKIVSYNILAHIFVKTPDIECFDLRIKKILDSLSSENASVISLQEVELSDFEKDFALLFSTYDYFGHNP